MNRSSSSESGDTLVSDYPAKLIAVSGVAPRPWLCPKGKCHGKKDIKQFTFITHCLIAGVCLAAGDMKLAGYKLLKSKISFKKQTEMCQKGNAIYF